MLAPMLLLALAGPPASMAATAGRSPSPDRPLTPKSVLLRRRSIGFGVTAGAFGLAWFYAKIIGTTSDPRTARRIVAGFSLSGRF